jgi:hypothetical protein
VTNDELAEVRAALEARASDCWLRLEDAVSELTAVHDASEAEIVAYVRAAVAAESAQS